jgi:hypothetical protein
MNKKEQERKYRQEMADGDKARQLLESPLMVEYYQTTKQIIMEQLGSGQIDSDKEKELIYFLKAVAYQERHFQKYIQKGSKARTLLERLLKR